MKAVLVIDMPNNCGECKLIHLQGIGESICDAVDWSKRPSWCPLKPLPNYRDNSKKPQDYADVWIDGAKTGWNACLDEITGETE